MKDCPISDISLLRRIRSAVMLCRTFNFSIMWYLNLLQCQSRSFKVIQLWIFRICPWELKIFEKIQMNKKMISRAVLEVIDAVEVDFFVTIFLGHHLVALGAYMVKIYFQRQYVEKYTKRNLLAWENRKNWLWWYLTLSSQQDYVFS